VVYNIVTICNAREAGSISWIVVDLATAPSAPVPLIISWTAM